MLEDGVYRDYSYAFNYEAPEALPRRRSLIVDASPVPAEQVTFTLNGRSFQTIIPPIYNVSTDQQATDCITGVLKPKGYRLMGAVVPMKLLATRSGLAKYGKNNITYVESMGSYHRLSAFYTNAPISEDHWQKPQMLDRCETCTACIKKYPSGAISYDRFLLRAKKCITYFNESERPFPDWIDPSWHNCLIGCMICQDVCPENPTSIRRIVHVATFSDEETNQILRGARKEELTPETIEKLKRIGLLFDDCKALARNLKALLDARE